MAGGKKKPKDGKERPDYGPKYTEDNSPLTALEVVGMEMGSIPVQNLRTGEFSNLALQEIAWKPRAALFIAKYGVRVLENIILGEEQTKDRIKALELLMAYTYGKPSQRVEHTGVGGGPIQMAMTRLGGLSIEDIEKIINYVPGQDDRTYVPAMHSDDYIEAESGEYRGENDE